MNVTREKLGPYKLLRILGRGGMSIVYEALDTRVERRVAIKVVYVPPQLATEDQATTVARLKREARVIARLSHPNVVAIFDVGEDDGLHYLVMEYIEGITLRQRLDEAGPLSYQDAAIVLHQIASALDAVHAAGIVHRDLKPSNVMLVAGEELRVKLLDFGVARPSDEANVTQAGFFVGTPAYLSPEQVSGEDIGPASDLWSLGVLLYEMLSCKTPFQSSAMHATLLNIVQSAPAPLDEIPPAIQDVINFALDKQPRHRFASGLALSRAYEYALKTIDLAGGMADAEPVPIPPVATAPTYTPAAESVSPSPVAPLSRDVNVSDTLITPQRPATAPVTSGSLPPPQLRRQSSRQTLLTGSVFFALLALVLGAIFGSRATDMRTVSEPTPPVSTPLPEPVPATPLPEPTSSAPRIERPKPRPTKAAPKPARRPEAKIILVPAPASPMPRPTPRPTASPAPTASPRPTPSPFPEIIATLEPEPTPLPARTREAERTGDRNRESDAEAIDEEEELMEILGEWIAVNNAQDVNAQMGFYPPRLDRYYTLKNVSREHVRADKERIIGRARQVTLEISEPTLAFSADGDTAILQFQKDYDIQGGPGERRGSVLQELRLRRNTAGYWKIVSERDLRVMRPR